MLLQYACVTAGSSIPCPSLKLYTPQEQARAAAEFDALPQNSPLGQMIVDYGVIREQVRMCRSL